MNDTAPARPWYCLHGVSWIAGSVILAAIVAENLFFPWVQARIAWGWPRHVVLWSYEDGYLIFNVTEFRLPALLVDITVAVFLLLGTIVSVEVRRRRRPSIFRFNLQVLFVAVSWAATIAALPYQWLIGWWVQYLAEIQWVVIHTAIALAWLGFFDVMSATWNRVVNRRDPARHCT